jgi:hypothetical protein
MGDSFNQWPLAYGDQHGHVLLLDEETGLPLSLSNQYLQDSKQSLPNHLMDFSRPFFADTASIANAGTSFSQPQQMFSSASTSSLPIPAGPSIPYPQAGSIQQQFLQQQQQWGELSSTSSSSMIDAPGLTSTSSPPRVPHRRAILQ